MIRSNWRLVVDQHLVHVGVQQVADHPQGDVGLGVEQRRRLGQLRALLQRLPEALEVGQVARQLARRGARGGRAHDEAAGLQRKGSADGPQPRALVVAQALADADAVSEGHVDHEPPGQRELHGQAHALAAHRVLRRLHQHLVAALQEVGDLPLALRHAQRGDLVHVQEAVLVEADLDEGGLHPREDVLDPPLPHVTHHRALAAALDVALGGAAVLQDGHPRLGAVDGDQDLLVQDVSPLWSRFSLASSRVHLGLRGVDGRSFDEVVAGARAARARPRRPRACWRRRPCRRWPSAGPGTRGAPRAPAPRQPKPAPTTAAASTARSAPMGRSWRAASRATRPHLQERQHGHVGAPQGQRPDGGRLAGRRAARGRGRRPGEGPGCAGPRRPRRRRAPPPPRRPPAPRPRPPASATWATFEGSRWWPASTCRSSAARSSGVPTRIASAPAPDAPPAREGGEPGRDVGRAGGHGHHGQRVLGRRRGGGHAEQLGQAAGRLGVAREDRDLAARSRMPPRPRGRRPRPGGRP